MTNIEKASKVIARLGYEVTDNPTFHDDCLSCNTPKIEGLHSCYDCKYYNIWDGEDKSEKYKFVSYFFLLGKIDKNDFLEKA